MNILETEAFWKVLETGKEMWRDWLAYDFSDSSLESYFKKLKGSEGYTGTKGAEIPGYRCVEVHMHLI